MPKRRRRTGYFASCGVEREPCREASGGIRKTTSTAASFEEQKERSECPAYNQLAVDFHCQSQWGNGRRIISNRDGRYDTLFHQFGRMNCGMPRPAVLRLIVARPLPPSSTRI